MFWQNFEDYYQHEVLKFYWRTDKQIPPPQIRWHMVKVQLSLC